MNSFSGAVFEADKFRFKQQQVEAPAISLLPKDLLAQQASTHKRAIADLYRHLTVKRTRDSLLWWDLIGSY